MEAQPAGDSGDARFAIDQFGRWIGNADAKAGLLAAGLVTLAGAAAQQGGDVGRHLPPATVAGWVTLLGLVACAGAMVTAAAFLVRAVTPSIEAPAGFSRYSWVSMAAASPAELVAAEPAADREQGWRTAVLLASIASRKFRSLRWAFRWSAVGAVAFLVALIAGF